MRDTEEKLSKDFIRLKEKVFEKTPILKEIISEKGGKSLFEHALQYKNVQLSPLVLERQQELIHTISERVKNLLGDKIANSVAKQLEKYYVVSTADHHGPICHPFFLNANLISATPYAEAADSVWQHIIVLSCANVSLNNSSFPRGLIFHSDIGGYRKLRRLSFFPAKDRAASVYGFRPYTKTDLDKVKKELFAEVKNGEVRQEIEDKIFEVIDGVYDKELPLAARDFTEQITQTNVNLWQRFFSPADKAPSLIYVDQESVAGDLLINFHLGKGTVIERIILDPVFEPLLSKYFNGIRGAFSAEHHNGTYLFWGLPEGQRYRKQMWRKGNELVSEDGKFRIPIHVQAIAEKLQNGELVPSMLLTFMLFSFYYGLKCMGGFYQPSYLTLMKEAYIKMMEEIRDDKNKEVCEKTETKTICGDISLAFLGDKNGSLHQATGLDLILYGDKNTQPRLVELSKNITLGEALDSMMPLFYEVLYSQPEREFDLRNITTDQIASIIGLHKKIKPCVEM
ncbi:MAG: hypothetical protein HYT15_04725 [Candidatus Magasanikbacteria bacterium]|nr:hypothetical protein [Candidatus Magasanikbacteria bacterium]